MLNKAHYHTPENMVFCLLKSKCAVVIYIYIYIYTYIHICIVYKYKYICCIVLILYFIVLINFIVLSDLFITETERISDWEVRDGSFLKIEKTDKVGVWFQKWVDENLFQTMKHLCWGLFFTKNTGWRPETFLKKSFLHWCFPIVQSSKNIFL